jgi:hypothetical protein
MTVRFHPAGSRPMINGHAALVNLRGGESVVRNKDGNNYARATLEKKNRGTRKNADEENNTAEVQPTGKPYY